MSMFWFGLAVGLVIGAFGGYTVTVKLNIRSRTATTIQKGNTAGGDIVGRNKH